MTVTFPDIQAAAKRIAGQVIQSPCPRSIPLSEATGFSVFCKLEYLQRTGSFKERGARNALLLLPPEQKERGVIAASAGNHALGLAYHGQLLGIPVTVVMPRFAPLTKVTNCRRLGATVVLHGADLLKRVRARMKSPPKRISDYINGYDDPAIIAGQGTLGLEIAAQVPDLDAVIVPIGGAGWLPALALALNHSSRQVQIIGVEPERAASFTAALAAGKPVTVEIQPTLADGLAVPQVGQNAFRIARKLVDKTLLVSEHEIALAVLRLLELEKAVVEGAGAAPLAACLAGLVPELKGKNVVLPLCGGNIDTPILGRVLERGLASDGRLFRFTATISDRPGGLARFAGLIAEAGASIIEIAHDRAFSSDDINTVNVHCVVETRDAAHIAIIRKRLDAGGSRLSRKRCQYSIASVSSIRGTVKTIVIAIGGNSLIKDAQHMSVPDQYAAVVETARHITDLLERRYRIVITHGNGPQVGFILLRSEHSRGILHQVPLDSIVADTQGALGYQIQQALENEFRRRGLKNSVATVVTQTLVDRDDPAFAKPSKPIGQFYTRARGRGPHARREMGHGRGRRAAAGAGSSLRPSPVRIIESEVVKHLVKDGYVVIAAGGGGIPVVADEQGILSGVAAVIDKDLASAVLAEEISRRPAGHLHRGREGLPELRQAQPAGARLDDRWPKPGGTWRKAISSRARCCPRSRPASSLSRTAAARRSSPVPKRSRTP